LVCVPADRRPGQQRHRGQICDLLTRRARAYLRHEVLGPRLHECTRLVNAVPDRSIGEIFGSPDDMKVRSSMTLFAHATEDNSDFLELLARYYDGNEDPLTLQRLT
jgi:uncharacterized protein (DUF1810 family)